MKRSCFVMLLSVILFVIKLGQRFHHINLNYDFFIVYFRSKVDLIDMRSVSFGGSNSIMHAKDYFSKFSWLSALLSKQAKYVAEHLRNIFFTFVPPKILQSDNGKEFVSVFSIVLIKLCLCL